MRGTQASLNYLVLELYLIYLILHKVLWDINMMCVKVLHEEAAKLGMLEGTFKSYTGILFDEIKIK